MSLLIEGMCTNLIVNVEIKEIRFTIQDVDGIFYKCDYCYDGRFPLRKGDMISAIGDWSQKVNAGEWENIFECKSLTARYEFDLLNFLITYMPYMKPKDESQVENITKYYRECTDRIVNYCSIMMKSYSIDNLNDMFNSLYTSMTLGDNETIIDFAKACFKNPDLKKIKSFLKIWNNNALIRPLELLGLTEEEIHKFHIPLYDVYKIAKTNPYRLPQIPIEKACIIVNNHLRLDEEPDFQQTNHKELEYQSTAAITCGLICRTVYDNINKRKWSSTPLKNIREKFPNFDSYRDIITEYYFCVEDFDSLYFEETYNIEVVVAKKMINLHRKPDVPIIDPIYPGLIPSEKQQEAIKGCLSKHVSTIEGGPGTGKTAIMSEIIRAAHRMGKKTLCLAFTGAASNRIRQTTTESGVFEMTEIMTINMAITLFSKIRNMRPNYVIIDEISMVNTGLLSQFISTFRLINYQFIFIGDENQLEPINWGNFMSCIKKTPLVRFKLTENFRSEKTIVKICQDLIDPGRIIAKRNVNWMQPADDYRFNIGDINFLEQLIAWYAHSFQMDSNLSLDENLVKFGFYRDRFTIVTPYVKLCQEINLIFQKYFISFVKEKTVIDGVVYYLGDRVMKLVNDYQINVMNGEQGKIIKVHENYIVCEFSGKPESITPYLEKSVFSAMKSFVKLNNIKLNPYKTVDGKEVKKSKEEIKVEIDHLRSIYLKEEQEDKKITKKIIKLYFDILEEYPCSMSGLEYDAEFLNIKNIFLAYALTTHKSQGSQYDNVIFFLNGKFNSFVTVNNVYTALSRAKTHLDIVVSSLELINSASLTRQRYVNDKLPDRINFQMTPEELKTLEPEVVEEVVCNDDCDFEFDECFDDFGY